MGVHGQGCQANPENEARRRQEEIESRERVAKHMLDKVTQARQEGMTLEEIATGRLGQLEAMLLAQKGADDLDAKGDAQATKGDDVDLGQRGVGDDDTKGPQVPTMKTYAQRGRRRAGPKGRRP